MYKNEWTSVRITASIEGTDLSNTYTLIVLPENMDFKNVAATISMPENGELYNPVTFSNPEDNYLISDMIIENPETQIADMEIVSSKFSVTPKKPGTARFLISWKYDSSVYAVLSIKVTGVLVKTADASIDTSQIMLQQDKDTTVALEAVGSKSSETFTWSSSDDGIASVDENGQVTAKSAGTVTIYAKSSLSTEETIVRGGIVLQFKEPERTYLNSISFFSYKMFEGWESNTSGFHSAQLDYQINIKEGNNTLSILRFTPSFDGTANRAVVSYQVSGGAYQEMELTDNTEISLSDALQPGHNLVYIKISPKEQTDLVTTYTFDIFRPYTTTNSITKLSLSPNGETAIEYPKYNGKTEGTIFRYDDKTDTLGTASFSQNVYTYKAFVYGERTSTITLTPKFGNVYEKVYLRKDKDDPVEAVSDWPSAVMELNETGITTFTYEVMSARAYAEALEKGEEFKAEKTYTIYVEKVSPLGINAQILSASLSQGEFYAPGFKSNVYATTALIPNGTDKDELTFEVPAGINVYLKSVSEANKLTGTANGDNITYTQTLSKGSNTIILETISPDDPTVTGQSSYKFTLNVRGPKDIIPDRILDYLCVGSQYTNQSNYGLTPERTLVNGGGILSLGNFGGYITYQYDTPIVNDEKNPYGIDFLVYGNSNGGAGFSEPGAVEVSQDGEHWYRLAGSVYYDDEADWNYSMTYSRGSNNASNWTDSNGNSGTNYLYPAASLYPLFAWTEDMKESMTVSGLKIESDTKDAYGSSSAAYPDFGYADVKVNGSSKGTAGSPYTGTDLKLGDGFDLDWAVDENGMPVELDAVSYIRVSTASSIYAGAIGEKSTEVTAVYRTTNVAEESVGQTVLPESITVDGAQITATDKADIYTAVYDGAFEVAVGASEEASVYINGTRGTSRTYETAPEKEILRIIVQEGEKEPAIIYIHLQSKEEYDTAQRISQVEEMIQAIGTVGLNSEEAIAAARAAYAALPPAEQLLISNVSLLETAETTLTQLKAEEASKIVSSVSLSRQTLAINGKQSDTLTATVLPATAIDKTVTWTSSNPDVATVDKNGVVTGITPGTADIIVTTGNNKTATCKVTIHPAAVTRITLNKTKKTVYRGKTFQLKTTAAPAYTTDTIRWTSSKKKVASVDANGKVTAKKKGTTVITATTSSGAKVTCKITVKTVKAKKIKLNKTKKTLKAGKTFTLKAILKPTKSTDRIKWKSSNKKIATVDANGKVTARKKGTVTITATTSSGKKATCRITVKK